MKIVAGDLDNPKIIDLLATHLAGMQANSPPESVYALNLSGLAGPDISVFAAWQGEALLGIGALREIDRASGEIKSMRTDAKGCGGTAPRTHHRRSQKARLSTSQPGDRLRCGVRTGAHPLSQVWFCQRRRVRRLHRLGLQPVHASRSVAGVRLPGRSVFTRNRCGVATWPDHDLPAPSRNDHPHSRAGCCIRGSVRR